MSKKTWIANFLTLQNSALIAQFAHVQLQQYYILVFGTFFHKLKKYK